jgi:hypothetical protein
LQEVAREGLPIAILTSEERRALQEGRLRWNRATGRLEDPVHPLERELQRRREPGQMLSDSLEFTAGIGFGIATSPFQITLALVELPMRLIQGDDVILHRVGTLPPPLTSTMSAFEMGNAVGVGVGGQILASALTRLATPGTVRVYRVESNYNQRVIVDHSTGAVSLIGDDVLHVNFGSAARAEEFLTRYLARGWEGSTIRSFEVPASFLDDLRAIAVPQRLARQFPNRPYICDATRAPDQFGLTPQQIEALQRAIIQGTGAQR